MVIPNSIQDIFSNTPERISITAILGDIIQCAEMNFGLRDNTYTILGIELSEDGPQIIFSAFKEKSIIIRITNDCRFDIIKAVFQVAHEVVHCLKPTFLGNSTYCEEGVATFFSYHYTNKKYGKIEIGNPKYEKAADLVNTLLNYKPTIIKELRKSEPSISSFTPEMITKNCPQIPHELATKLTTNFQQDI